MRKSTKLLLMFSQGAGAGAGALRFYLAGNSQYFLLIF